MDERKLSHLEKARELAPSSVYEFDLRCLQSLRKME